MKVKLEFEMSRPDEIKDALRVAMAKLVCTGNNKGEKIICKVADNGDLIFAGRADVGPQLMKMGPLIEVMMQAYAQAK